MLTAVNDVISALGGQELAALTVSNPKGDERTALLELSKQRKLLLLEKDWKANYEEKVAFVADASGNILLHAAGDPAAMNILRLVLNEVNPAQVNGTYGSRDVEMRRNGITEASDWQAWDIVGKSFTTWPKSVNTYFNVTRNLEYLQLPPAYQNCVLARAKANVLVKRGGDTGKLRAALAEAARADEIMMQDNLYKGGLRAHRRIVSRQTVFDNPTVGAIRNGSFPWLGV